MPDTAEIPYVLGEALVWTDRSGDMPTRRGVEFQGLSNGGTSALVKWGGGESFVVPLSALSRAASPNTVPAWLPNWFEVKPPATPPSQAFLDERISAARRALAVRHQRVKDIQLSLDQARQIVDRASKELETAQAALRVHDQHQKAAQIALEESLRLGRPVPALANGHDPRTYLTDKLAMTSAALEKFQNGLADQMRQMNEALGSVRKAAGDVLSLLVQRETEALRRLEIQSAVTRSELLSVVNFWFGGAELGPIKLPPVTATYLEMQPAFGDVMEAREKSAESRIKPWRQIYDALVTGDVQADFALGAE